MNLKSKKLWRFLCLSAALLSGIYLLLGGAAGILSLVLTHGNFAPSVDTAAASIGIIGGADGPTAIFVSAPPAQLWAEYLIAGAIFAASIVAFVYLKKK